MTALPAPGSTSRTQIKRLPEKTVNDREVAYAILDAGLMAHVAVVTDGQPYVVPVGYARRGDEVIFHGSSASRLFRTLADGAPTCLTVTHLDGLVLARSLFESSMHYRTVMALGTCRRLEGDEEVAALLDLSESLMPGRTSDARHPTAQELKATITLALPLDEISVKVSDGPPDDVDSDLVDPVYSRIWAGYVPIVESLGMPVADELASDVPLPDYVRAWRRG
jgi:nitroimidazol reductase NimA-like FMN-containing flavoprotein (pyridoxamine 5'-phosphate oxidase superfamily)